MNVRARASARRSRQQARLIPGLLLFLATLAELSAQERPTTKEEEEAAKAAPVDPYTEADPKAMAAAGIVAYGPFPWGGDKSTADVDKVLGEKRIRWVETAHFRIGCALPSQALPATQDRKRAMLDEVKDLRKKLPKVPERPAKLDPWLRLHLYAQRAEASYAAFSKMLGVTDADFGDGLKPREGRYLGLPDKFQLLLFQKKSDQARYMDRFCGVKTDEPYRHYDFKAGQMLAALSVEGLDHYEDGALHRYMTYLLVHNYLSGYQGFFYALPFWFGEGTAHWFSRKIESDFVVANLKDDESVDQERQNEWARKVRRRAHYDATIIPFATMQGWQKWEDMGFQAHAQAWSRVDFLMSKGPEKVGQMIKVLKNLPLPTDGTTIDKKTIDEEAAKQLQALWGLDAAKFDQEWRQFVLKTYPKK
jgi:hypothetical protein